MSKEIVVGCPFCGDRKAKTPDVDPDDYDVWFAMLYALSDSCRSLVAALYALSDSCRSLVAAIEQISGKCQTREQRSALIIGREALAALQRLESAGRVGDGKHDGGEGRAMKTCTWAEDADGNWRTGCQQLHIIIDGTPAQNEYEFCPYCGVKIETVIYNAGGEFRRDSGVGTSPLLGTSHAPDCAVALNGRHACSCGVDRCCPTAEDHEFDDLVLRTGGR